MAAFYKLKKLIAAHSAEYSKLNNYLQNITGAYTVVYDKEEDEIFILDPNKNPLTTYITGTNKFFVQINGFTLYIDDVMNMIKPKGIKQFKELLVYSSKYKVS